MTLFRLSIVAALLLGNANDATADSADAVSSRLQVHVRFNVRMQLCEVGDLHRRITDSHVELSEFFTNN